MMMLSGKCLLVASSFFVLSVPAVAQDYVPMAKPDPTAPAPIAPPEPPPAQSVNPIAGDPAPPVKAPAPVNQVDFQPPTGDIYTCASPPPLHALKTNITNKAMSSQQALKLGLPVGGFSAQSDAQVFVQDWTRSKPCLSTDGKTQLLYGQALRIVASISQMEAGVDVNLATIAAQATLKNRSSNIEAVVIGIPDITVQTDAASLLGPIDVSNYATKSDLAAKLAKRAISSNTGTAEFLGVITTEVGFAAQAIATFALQRVSEQKNCSSTKALLSARTPAELDAVTHVYVSVTGSCDSSQPTVLSKATALNYLGGIRVKLN